MKLLVAEVEWYLPFKFGLKQNKAVSSASTDFIQSKYETKGLKKV